MKQIIACTVEWFTTGRDSGHILSLRTIVIVQCVVHTMPGSPHMIVVRFCVIRSMSLTADVPSTLGFTQVFKVA